MLRNDIGINAGVIWRLLSEKGKLSLNEICEFTLYKESFVYFALGWLSKEDKIKLYDENGVISVELNIDLSDIYY